MLQRDAADQAAVLPTPALGAAGVRRRPAVVWRLRLSADDRAALGMWAGAYLALLVLAWAAAWTFRIVPSHAPLTGVFEHWDAIRLRNIAEYGYFARHSMADNVAFFPGYPIALAAAHAVLRNWVLSELVVSAAAGCVAVVALARLAGGSRAVLYLLTAPAAVFLTVGYTECLFLAFAIPAWAAATRGQFWRAALLAGAAGLVSPQALFMIPALAVMALTGDRGSRLANAGKVCFAIAGPAAYEIYLTVSTGTWKAWQNAQEAGWYRHFVTPVQAFKTTWWAAFQHPFPASYSWEFQLEIAAMAAMVLATLAFGCLRRWPETVYCGLAVLALGTSTWYESLPRGLLLLFPVWIALARLEPGRPWVRYVYLSVCAPIAAVLGLLFLTYQWAG
jgi:hypothetical protein